MGRISWMLGLVLVVAGLSCVSAVGLRAQEPASDHVAFRRARAVTDPGERVAALLKFVREFPESSSATTANRLALETDLEAFPERTTEIHELASRDVNGAPAGFERWLEQSHVADMLASAGASGADLADAKVWAEGAVAALTEQSFRRENTLAQARFKLPPLTARQVHRDFVSYRAAFLAALANVDLRTKQPEAAEPLLAEAYRLQPLSAEVNRLRGQLALLKGKDSEALEDFERAEAAGALKEPWHGEMVRLYEAANPDGEGGLERKIDQVYEGMYPPVYMLPARRLPAGGHTVLLELFTGAGCDPCVAPDLAVESLLKTYSRQDLVVLEYDENIPRPDPLTNPSSEARAIGYRVGTTPEAFLDGESLPVAGASRADAENVVIGFGDALEDRAAEATGVELSLKVAREAGGKIMARANVSERPGEAGGAVGEIQGAGSGSRVSGAAHRRTELRFALVQDHIRYSGENGVRFHRMVVRGMESGSRRSPGEGNGVYEAAFDTSAIQAQLMAYLDAYEKGNDRFGQFQFREKVIPIDPAELAVVAWVEDSATHEVLQTAYAGVATN